MTETRRLYYEDVYKKEFTATVVECREQKKGYAVILDESAFYPEGGGQPSDVGTLGDAKVTEVHEKDGELLHYTDKALEVGAKVEGKIDWARRFDHMQQHAGDHLLAGALHRAHGGYTIGLHLGERFSTIDVTLPDGRTRLTESELAALENEVNREIQGNFQIRSFFPTPAEMAALPLRKAPSVKTHIRVVLMGDFECVACGGTHPDSTGQLGALKILDVAPSKGNMRVSFVCGMRAIAYFQTCACQAQVCASSLSTGVEQLADKVARLLERQKDAEYHLRKARLEAALLKADALLSDATPLSSGGMLVCAVLPGLDVSALREAAARLIANGGVCALLAGDEGEGAPLVFARSDDLAYPMGALLAQAARASGGKGGGRADFAQGAGFGRQALDCARAQLSSNV